MYDNFTQGHVDAALYYIGGIAFFFLLAITTVMIYFVWRYSARRHPVAVDIRGNFWLEVVWLVLPTLIALSMFYVGWQSYIELRTVPKDAMVIKTVAQMYQWEFSYPDGKHSTAELIVPVGQAIKIDLTSKDVVHSFFLPAFRIKIDAVPQTSTYAWFKPEKIGTYDIFCAVYCGSGHADMHAILRVVSGEEFAAWLKKQTKAKEDSDEDYR